MRCLWHQLVTIFMIVCAVGLQSNMLMILLEHVEVLICENNQCWRRCFKGCRVYSYIYCTYIYAINIYIFIYISNCVCVWRWSCLQAWNIEVKWASMPHGMNEMIDMPGRKFGWHGSKRMFWRGNRSFKRGTNRQSPKSSLEGFNMVQFVNMGKIQHQLIFQLPSTTRFVTEWSAGLYEPPSCPDRLDDYDEAWVAERSEISAGLAPFSIPSCSRRSGKGVNSPRENWRWYWLMIEDDLNVINWKASGQGHLFSE